MTGFRPLADADLRMLAAYLVGTNMALWIGLSECGFWPCRYGKHWLLNRLRDGTHLIRDGRRWRYESD
jgi:hypothetical protein